jgi:hypothetical protein
MGCSFISLRETTIINNIDVILHGFMLQIIYTTIKEIYVIFIHLFDSGILMIIDLNKKKKGGEFYL